jgi:hypothetical protein
MIKLKTTIGLTVIALLALTFTSCEKDKDKTPDYVGTWTNEEVDNSMGDPITITSKLVLTVSTFDMSMFADLGIVTMQMAGMKGGLSVSGSQITIEPNSVGMADFDTGVMTWINKGDEGWDDALAEMDMSESESAEYRVEGNQLIITFEDSEEVYTKE